MSIIALPWDDRPYAPGIADLVRLAEQGRPLAAEAPRNGLPEPGYAYRGTGQVMTRRQERMQALAALPPGTTVRQAAEQIGVNMRTVTRYRRDLGRTGRAT